MKTKTILATLLAFLMLASCKPKVSKEIVEKLKAENEMYEETYKNHIIIKDDLIKENEDNYNQFLSNLDKNAKSKVEKDHELQALITNNKNCLLEIADKLYSANMLSKATVVASDEFISLVEKGEFDQDEAELKWMEYQNRITKLQLQTDSLTNELTNNKDQLYELYKQAVNKYNTPVKEIKKKK